MYFGQKSTFDPETETATEKPTSSEQMNGEAFIDCLPAYGGEEGTDLYSAFASYLRTINSIQTT